MYIERFIEILNERPKLFTFISGCALSFAFAPYFFFPLLISLGFFSYFIKQCVSIKEAMKIGWLFGLGFYLCNLYWISIGVSVYIDDFWWAIPFALFALPACLSIYTMLVALVSYSIKTKNFYINSFTCIWIISELLRSYLFTGFSWNIISSSFSFSENAIQITNIIGSYGLGAVVVFSFSSFCLLLERQYLKFLVYAGISAILWSSIFYYGNHRLFNNQTTEYEIKVRLVQPSIKQTDKWTIDMFWSNFNQHKSLSLDNISDSHPDIIIWPEAAITIQPSYTQVFNALRHIVSNTNMTLITGGITDNVSQDNRKKDKLFTSIYAIQDNPNLVFEYHKSHLVPFGEYMPLKSILPFHKLTPGNIDFYPGKPGFIVSLDNFNLRIRPLLCYEIIFPDEVRMSNKDANVILNLTNDSYYGNTSGPYQHFYMARMRAVENGIPLIRVANNGISAVFDPLGRILIKTKLNDITYIDSYIPASIKNETPYSMYGNRLLYLYMLISLFIEFLLPRMNKIPT